MTKRELRVKRTTMGLGLFTAKLIPTRRRIIEYIGPIIAPENRNGLSNKYLFELKNGCAIDGRSRSNLARYINHSCRPNAIAYREGKRVWIWSRKKIRAEEQITINYGRKYLEQFIEPLGCKCEKCAFEIETDL